MALNLKEIKRHAKEYVELEAHTTVLDVRFVKRYRLFGQEDVVLSVRTTEKKDPNWWVIGGSTPMNLYSMKMFPEADIAYSLHHGLMLRMADRNYGESKTAPEDIGYDAFISHASEDKEKMVKPLANALSRMKYRVWYDEFELRVGDSLRKSTDKGLLKLALWSCCSLARVFCTRSMPAFRVAKKWPQYELDGLTAREVIGHKVVLPIWHMLDRDDVLAYSPTLADKVALSTRRISIKKIAEALEEVFESEMEPVTSGLEHIFGPRTQIPQALVSLRISWHF